MSENQFKQGDRVRHKSGAGPVMIVDGPSTMHPNSISCHWWNSKDNSFQSESIPLCTLEKCSPESSLDE